MKKDSRAEANSTTFAGGGSPQREDQVEMTYDEAMALKAKGGAGWRKVLTERGWVRVDGQE